MSGSATYTTQQGDTWDVIAKRVYDDERKAQVLMECRENIRLLDIEVFSAGVEIFVPEVQAQSETSDLPDWRR